VAEPERDPAAVGLLRADEVAERAGDGRLEGVAAPRAPGRYAVRGEARAAAVEGQLAPPSAERGDPAVGILEPEEPAGAERRRPRRFGVVAVAQGRQRQESARGV